MRGKGGEHGGGFGRGKGGGVGAQLLFRDERAFAPRSGLVTSSDSIMHRCMYINNNASSFFMYNVYLT